MAHVSSSGSTFLCDWLAKGIRISEALNAEEKPPASIPQPDGGVRKLPLSKSGKKHKGQFALVSSEMWELVNQHNWTVHRKRTTMYARRNIKGKTVYLHTYIYNRLVELGQKPALLDNQVVDHIDEDGLNNTNANLQPLTNGENVRKGRAHRGLNVSSKPVRNGQFKAVDKCIEPRGGRFKVTVRCKHVGYLPTLEEARIFRDMAKKEGVEAAKQLLRERHLATIDK